MSYPPISITLPLQTADKRKAMLDELAMEIITEKSRHKEELSDVRLQHEKEVLGVRARYEKELRGLHEDKNRTEEGIRSQLRDEKVKVGGGGGGAHLDSGPHSQREGREHEVLCLCINVTFHL